MNLGFTFRISSAYTSWGISCLKIRKSGEKKREKVPQYFLLGAPSILNSTMRFDFCGCFSLG